MTTAGGFGDLMRDPDQAEARIDAWAQQFADKAQRYQAVQQRTAEIRLTSTSPDGAVRVTVRSDGSVTDLSFGDRARTIPLEELSGKILDTMRRAQAGIADQVAEVLAEQLGDEDQQTRSLMLGELRSRFPDPDAEEEPPAEPETPAADPGTPSGATRPPAAEDDEENNPW
ncbi:YbaB/EbfC family nucleoid-associated protein [Amycolatopsis anabasis]|uniref:YbaB/EbfC family nucleoid-associated protein n=1 Tax=Amycolatopsis anabasis TaxID=1840409 RepID=UPI00131B211E|nr:YbaB/EbfC family nucleoid-associated protein [Amycolatopsis anabasis]